MVHIEEYGLKSGRPLLFFHGFPGSHLQASFLDSVARELGVRVLGVDRPGYGLTAPSANMATFLTELDKALRQKNIEDFFIVGVSGGNPAALSAADFFGKRVLAIASVAGLAPLTLAPETYPEKQRKWLLKSRLMPNFLLKPLIESLMRGVKIEDRVQDWISKLPSADREALASKSLLEVMIASLNMARRQGAEGIVFDLRTYANDWSVHLSDIKVPYTIWHGEADNIVMPLASAFVHQQISQSRLKVLPGMGHYSLPLGFSREILADLLASAKK